GTLGSYLVIDTTIPHAEVWIASDSDSGVKGDNITNQKNPVLNGTTEPGATVKIQIGDAVYETKADSSGVWSLKIGTALQEGSNNYTVTVVDSAGNESSSDGVL
ncbi:Ig-like domain-containing protein, partial [Escherichia coli]